MSEYMATADLKRMAGINITQSNSPTMILLEYPVLNFKTPLSYT